MRDKNPGACRFGKEYFERRVGGGHLRLMIVAGAAEPSRLDHHDDTVPHALFFQAIRRRESFGQLVSANGDQDQFRVIATDIAQADRAVGQRPLRQF